MAYYTVVVTIETDEDEPTDAVVARLHSGFLGLAQVYGKVPGCNWEPDQDTVADGLGCYYHELRVVDCNPMREVTPT